MVSRDDHDKKRKARSSDVSKSSKKSKSSSQDEGHPSKPASDEAALHLDVRTGTGPVIVSCPDFQVPPEVPFTLYTAPPLQDESGVEDEESREQTLLVGEDETMRYVSNNGDWTSFADEERGMSRVREYDGEYMLGVFDPDTRTVTLRRAPLLSVRRTVRSHAELNPMATGATDYTARLQQRRHLGDLFGNRKMKAKASNQDRMRVEGSSAGMQRILTQVSSGIQAASKDRSAETQAPGQTAEADAIRAGVPAEVLRYIPLPNVAAEHPEEVYPISTLIPPEVMQTFKLGWVTSIENEASASKSLPAPTPAKSAYMTTRFWEAVKAFKSSQTKASEDRVKMAYYASILWGLLFSERQLNKRKDLARRLKISDSSGNSPLLNHLYLTFSEPERGSTQRHVTMFTRTKLLSYLLAILLHLDAFAIDYGRLSTELELTSKKVGDILHSLGCRSGMTSSSAEDRKVPQKVLRLPLTWPKPKRV